MQNYPLINPKLRLLAGEEIKRRFEWRVICTNPDNYTTKERAQLDAIMSYVTQELSTDNQDPEKIKRNLSDIQKYYKYDYQDIREKLSTDILKFYFQDLECQRKFNEGFMHALISSDELYRLDIVAGAPKLTVCDPLRVYVYGNGLSPYIDEADIIVEDTYESVGSIIDEFHESLTERDIKNLEEKTASKAPSGDVAKGDVNYNFRIPTIYNTAFTTDVIAWDYKNYSANDAYYDDQGNVRVIRTRWKSKRKVGKLKFYDETNTEQYRIVDEYYVPDEQYGEEVKWFWINEYWEGTKIGEDIYVNIRPLPHQYTSFNNISKCTSGYIGTVYNIGSLKGRSLFDQLKPFQYLYNIFMYRTELAFASYKGSKIVIPSSLIPNDWEMEKWLHYSEILGYLIVNPFNEVATGSLDGPAGQLNQFQPQILSDDSVANYINANIQMLSYIEKQVGSISGVSEQRQGQVETKELVGNVERAITQSSHVTELWFYIHENTKTRVLTQILELAKYCIKKKSDKRYYHILDEFSIQVLENEPEFISEADLSLFVTSSSKYIEFEQAIKQLAHAAMQNQMIGFKEVIDIYQANSIVDMSKIMENAEELKRQQAMQAEQAQRDHEKEIQQMQLQVQQEMQKYEIDRREDEQIHEIAKIKIEAEENRKTEILKASIANNPEIQASEVAMKAAEIEAKMSLSKEKQDKELALKEEKQRREIELMNKKMQDESKRLEKDHNLNKKESDEYLKLDKKKVEKEIALSEKQFKHDKEIDKEELKLKEKETEEKIKAAKEKAKADIEMRKQKGAQDLETQKAKNQMDLEYKEEENKVKLEAKKKELKQKAKKPTK